MAFVTEVMFRLIHSLCGLSGVACVRLDTKAVRDGSVTDIASPIQRTEVSIQRVEAAVSFAGSDRGSAALRFPTWLKNPVVR
jgi:hypothetical protein